MPHYVNGLPCAAYPAPVQAIGIQRVSQVRHVAAPPAAAPRRRLRMFCGLAPEIARRWMGEQTLHKFIQAVQDPNMWLRAMRFGASRNQPADQMSARRPGRAQIMNMQPIHVWFVFFCSLYALLSFSGFETVRPFCSFSQRGPSRSSCIARSAGLRQLPACPCGLGSPGGREVWGQRLPTCCTI